MRPACVSRARSWIVNGKPYGTEFWVDGDLEALTLEGDLAGALEKVESGVTHQGEVEASVILAGAAVIVETVMSSCQCRLFLMLQC